MPYPIVFTNTASAQFTKLKDKKLKERMASALEYIAKEPFLGKPLQAEFKGCYSYRVGDYRILYAFYKEKRYIGVMRVDHRRDIYR
jgi:addiction module RelE/StbE family toxin